MTAHIKYKNRLLLYLKWNDKIKTEFTQICPALYNKWTLTSYVFSSNITNFVFVSVLMACHKIIKNYFFKTKVRLIYNLTLVSPVYNLDFSVQQRDSSLLNLLDYSRTDSDLSGVSLISKLKPDHHNLPL